MEFLRFEFFGNTVQAYLVFIGIFFAAVIAAMIANRHVKHRIAAWAEGSQTEVDDLIITRIFTPVTYLIVIVSITIGKTQLHMDPRLGIWIDKILLVLGLVTFFFIVIRFFQGLIEVSANGYVKRLRAAAPEDLEEQEKAVERIKKQVREVSNMILAIIAILTILSNLGVDLKAIWASLGIGGIAIVVAVKEPLTNLVGRMYIFSTGIFDEGHFIVFDKWAGTVKQIGLFRTYMELFSDMTNVSIPNADFIKGVVKNYYGRKRFMYKWDLDVPYDVSPERIQGLIKAIRELLQDKPEVNQDACWVYLARLDRYAKVVRAWFQVNLPDWSSSLFYGGRLLQEIQKLFESQGINFAFPTQTLHLKPDAPFLLPELPPASAPEGKAAGRDGNDLSEGE